MMPLHKCFASLLTIHQPVHLQGMGAPLTGRCIASSCSTCSSFRDASVAMTMTSQNSESSFAMMGTFMAATLPLTPNSTCGLHHSMTPANFQ